MATLNSKIIKATCSKLKMRRLKQCKYKGNKLLSKAAKFYLILSYQEVLQMGNYTSKSTSI